MNADDFVDRDLMLTRFRRLVAELTRGCVKRTLFQPWEMAILADIESCELARKRRIGALRSYERAVARQLESGAGPPMKFSEFLERRRTRRPSMKKAPSSTIAIASE
jgi:hypothetical protein